MIAQFPHTSKELTHWRPRESSFGNALYIATFRAESQTPLGTACRSTTLPREPPRPLLTELGNHLLGQRGYRHGAPSGAVRFAREREIWRSEAALGARYWRGLRLAVRRVQPDSAPVAASRAGYFGLRISAFFRISGFGLQVWGTDRGYQREQTTPTYGIFRRMVSRCAQSGFGAG